MRLIPFELRKIWQRKSILAFCVLLLIHVFMLWYTTLPGEGRVSLSSYRTLGKELAGRSEEEKGKYLTQWKDLVEGVLFVQEILVLQGFEGEMRDSFVQQELDANPGVFEAYYQAYRQGEALWFTDSLEQEALLLWEIYEEWEKTAGYGDYLASIQEQKDTMGGISVFGGRQAEGYSIRNLEKSAGDYRGLTGEGISFTPSKTVTLAMESIWPRLLLFLALLLLVGNLITQEKEKGLFLITRGTRHGISSAMAAKLLALLMSCLALTALFYSVSLLFAGGSAGWFDPGIRLQSVAVYRESCLNITLGGYLLLSVLFQGLALFGLGGLLMFFGLMWDLAVLPYLAGVTAAGVSGLLYAVIPAGSPWAALKYLNPAGLLRTEHIFGGYLNFNLLGQPVSRLSLAVFFTVLLAAAGTVSSLAVFVRRRGFGARKLSLSFRLPFSPHDSLVRHESYKLLIAGRGLLLFLVFAALLSVRDARQTYHPTAGEQYYRDLMEDLEGKLDSHKEALVQREQKRYEEAFQKLEQIDALEASGELSQEAAEDLRQKEYMTLSFYPSFQRAEEQYQRLKEGGGSFVYDTGYRYLLGMWEDGFSVDFLILSVGIILISSGALTMEFQKGSWYLLGATRAGRRRVLQTKILICCGMALALALAPLTGRIWAISRTYPMGNLLAGIGSLLPVSGWAASLPIAVYLALFVLSQLAAAAGVALVTLALSWWRRQQAQTVFFALALLAVPPVMKLLGFEAARWCSLYPLYGWTGMV